MHLYRSATAAERAETTPISLVPHACQVGSYSVVGSGKNSFMVVLSSRVFDTKSRDSHHCWRKSEYVPQSKNHRCDRNVSDGTQSLLSKPN